MVGVPYVIGYITVLPVIESIPALIGAEPFINTSYYRDTALFTTFFFFY
jgi:hypothetical protein